MKGFWGFLKNLSPVSRMTIMWVLTNIFWLAVVLFLIWNLGAVDFSEQQDLPNQTQTQQYRAGK